MKIAQQILAQYYDLSAVQLKKMDGYGSLNYRVLDEKSGNKYVLKLNRIAEADLPFLQAENAILQHLSSKNAVIYPQPILANTGKNLIEYKNEEGDHYYARLLTFLEGTFLAETPKTRALMASFGSFLAEMNTHLQDFQNATVAARRDKWDLQYCLFNKQYLSYIEDATQRKIVQHFLLQFKENIQPKLPFLRRQIIHSDANDWNVLTQNGQISGIIDFGDMCFSPLINEVAIAITYAIFEQENPLELAAALVKAYHEKLPLEVQEIELLYDLIAARLCVSVLNSAYSKHLYPDNKYIQISEQPAWSLLHKWLTINPIKAKNVFLVAINIHVKPQRVSDILAQRHQHISSALSVSYKEPIHMERAAFQYMYAADGTTFLDAYNNIPLVGHQHPKVVAAAQRQIAKLNTNTRYLYDVLQEYSARLLAKFPAKLNKVFFVNSGSAASDLAIRIATTHTQRNSIAVLEHGYHGNTQIGIQISPYKHDGKGGKGTTSNILKLPMPDTYRGKYRGFSSENGQKYAQEALEIIEKRDDVIGAFIHETILGCGGQVPLPPDYLATIYPKIRAQGGICIADEVQTGFGRMGDYFWSYEMQNITPDIVILGKPMGNGHPLAAVVTTDEIAASFANGMEFFSSFGGNPVSCAVGLAVLNVLEEEQLQAHSKEVGDYCLEQFKALQKNFLSIGDVRGMGLFIGVDFVKNVETREPDTTLAQYIKNGLRQKNILTSTDGPHDNVLKMKPPLCFTKENVDEVVKNIANLLNARRS